MSDKFDLEKALNKLDSIVAKLESKDVSPDERVQLFDEGVKLAKQCADKLTQIKGSVNKLKGELESLSFEKFDADAE